jgi:hypothetical protein
MSGQIMDYDEQLLHMWSLVGELSGEQVKHTRQARVEANNT